MTSVEVTGQAIPRLSRREITGFARRVLLAVERLGALDRDTSELSIAFVDDATMKTLNKRFREKSTTTDVLTFPADDTSADPQSGERPLGEIVISVDQARRQATAEKHSLATEVRYLIVHGILHALGHDHETDKGEMAGLEYKVRAEVGLKG